MTVRAQSSYDSLRSCFDLITVMFGTAKGPKLGKPSTVLMLNPPVVPAIESLAGYNACMRAPFGKRVQINTFCRGSLLILKFRRNYKILCKCWRN